MTVRASCTCPLPLASTYSTPLVCPSSSVRRRTALQWVRRSKLPVARASGTEVRAGYHRSSLKGPKPAIQEEYGVAGRDRKSTRLNSSHANISYAVFCLKKKHIIYSNVHTSLTAI